MVGNGAKDANDAKDANVDTSLRCSILLFLQVGEAQALLENVEKDDYDRGPNSQICFP